MNDVAQLRRIAAQITRELGIRMPDSKLAMLRSRLERRMSGLGLGSLDDYEPLLADPAELVALYDLATTNKTDFFRERDHFTYLTQQAVPALGLSTLRVWCAGCSTGEEVYTLAMVLDDYARTHRGFSYTIHGTDISTRVLRHAFEATYDEALAEPIPSSWRQRYLLRSKDRERPRVRIAPELRKRVSFSRLNFMDGEYDLRGEFDVVFFRNVMIYFDRETQQQVVSRQCRHLRRGGYLFIGHTESLSGQTLPLVAQTNSVWRKS
jgi:chemotaxis protein methyltransferase CheR